MSGSLLGMGVEIFTYAAVETEEAVAFEDMDKGAEHASRAIGSAGLESDLSLQVSFGLGGRRGASSAMMTYLDYRTR